MSPFMTQLAASSSSDQALALLRQHGERLHEYFAHIRARHQQAPPRLVESIQYSLPAARGSVRPNTAPPPAASACGRRSSSNAATPASAPPAALARTKQPPAP